MFIDSILFLHISVWGNTALTILGAAQTNPYMTALGMGDVCDGGKASSMGATQDGGALQGRTRNKHQSAAGRSSFQKRKQRDLLYRFKEIH